MDSFEINRLTDFDFESVCKDIFEAQLDVPLEIFTRGPDQGIDLRYLSGKQDADIVIQCKHWARSGRRSLIRHMERTERKKIDRLAPKRYILATSVPLTPSAKKKLTDALDPHLLSAGDIYGMEELESILRARPDIVQRHLRLWLSNTSVLQTVLNKTILTRSDDLMDEAHAAMLVYVPNQSYHRAREILEEQHVCIITGLPGIGKTTLAQVLSVSYGNSGYQVFEVSNDADEVNSVWDDSVAQLFYYDDFLGQTTLDDKLHKNEDSRLIRILRRVHNSKSKRIILTTREYILEQARQRYERIGSEDFTPLTATLSLGDYTRIIRAEILYNHVYFSGLLQEDKAIFANQAVYKKIIESPKFNPRLIDYSIRISVDRGHRGEAVAEELFENLATPRRIWEHVVRNQLDYLSVQVLTVLFYLDQRNTLTDLKAALDAYNAQTGDRFSDRDLRKSLKILDGTMVRVTPKSSNVLIEYENPSITDYMREYIFSSEQVLVDLLNSIANYAQLRRLWVYFNQWKVAGETLGLPSVRQAVIDVAIRVFDQDAAGKFATKVLALSEKYDRSSRILEIGERVNSEDIREMVLAWLCSIDLYDFGPSTDSVVDLAKVMFTSTSPRIRQFACDALDGIIEYITQDVSDWDNARGALDDLSRLEDVVPPALVDSVASERQSLEENLDDKARHWIERVAETGEIPGWMDNIDEMLSHASYYSDPDEHFPGFSQASEFVRGLQTEAPDTQSRLPSVSDSALAVSDSAQANDGEDEAIDRMLGTLRNEGI